MKRLGFKKNSKVNFAYDLADANALPETIRASISSNTLDSEGVAHLLDEMGFRNPKGEQEYFVMDEEDETSPACFCWVFDEELKEYIQNMDKLKVLISNLQNYYETISKLSSNPMLQVQVEVD